MGRAHRNRLVQHRSRRETKEVELKTELHQLRSQNQKLRRENSRLRRENEKLNSQVDSFDEFAEDTPAPLVIEASKQATGCPNRCGVELRRIPTPFKTVVVCPECKWRTREDQSDKKSANP